MEHVLWYNHGSEKWREGLPTGNGRLAAMIYGDASDKIALNHEWLWRGKNRYRDNEKVDPSVLAEVRRLLKKGDFFKATAVANAYYGGLGGISDLKNRVDPYQPAGEIRFETSAGSSVTKRTLDIENGIVVSERGKIVLTSFCDINRHGIISCWRSDRVFSGKLSFMRPEDDGCIENRAYSADKITYKCSIDDGISFTVTIAVDTDGKAVAADDGISIENASYIYTAAYIANDATDAPDSYIPSGNADLEEIMLKHSQSFSEVFNRFSLEIEAPPYDDIPTDERLKNLREGKTDENLMMLYFHYGRYLMISSSVCGTLPANLQGKWNADVKPPWECDYHFDINLQMSYWMTEPLNMPDCSEALLTYVESYLPHAKKAAKDLFDTRGIFLPLQSDAWGRATPESYGWAVWFGSAAWIEQHFWLHWIYNKNIDFLREHAYPFFRETALFYEDFLVKDSNGIYQIMPSQSPENRFEGTGCFPVSLGVSAAMDVQLCYDALGYAIDSAKILGIDEDEIAIWTEIRSHLPEFRIGSDGRLLEWDKERVEVEPEHRHIAHLYGLHPSHIFNPEERPAQYEACKKSLEYRLSFGSGQTGWSRAWVACFYAALGNGEKVHEHLLENLKEFATETLLNLHPPLIFQIDGNFGFTAAVLECLAQYWNGKTHLLYALPQAWSNGSVRGLKLPGGEIVNMTWKDGVITEKTVSR